MVWNKFFFLFFSRGWIWIKYSWDQEWLACSYGEFCFLNTLFRKDSKLNFSSRGLSSARVDIIFFLFVLNDQSEIIYINRIIYVRLPSKFNFIGANYKHQGLAMGKFEIIDIILLCIPGSGWTSRLYTSWIFYFSNLECYVIAFQNRKFFFLSDMACGKDLTLLFFYFFEFLFFWFNESGFSWISRGIKNDQSVILFNLAFYLTIHVGSFWWMRY